MNKRITGLALILVLLSALCAWAAPEGARPSLRIDTSSIPTIMKGDENFSFDIDYVSEDLDLLRWSVSPAEAQSGLKFDTEKAQFTVEGKPTKVGTFKFTVTAVGSWDVYGTSKDVDGEYVSLDKTITVKKTYNLVVAPWAPSDIVDSETGSTVSPDLDEVIVKTGLLANSETAPNLTAITFKTKATLPLTSWKVDGLPAGIKAKLTSDGSEELENKETENGSDDITIVLEGTPTKAGVYNSIYVTVANKAGSKTSGPHTLRVFDKAKITTTKLPDMTWGKNYSFTLAATGGLTNYPISWDLATTATELEKLGPGMSFDAETGKLFGVTASTDTANTDLAFGTSKDLTVTLKFKAKSPIGDDGTSEEKELPLKVLAVAPKILSKDEKQGNFDEMELVLKNTDGTITSLSEDASTELNYTYDGPGTVKWSVSKLPDGFASEDATDGGPFKIKITTGAAAQVLKRYPLTVTAKNSVGSDTSTIYINLNTSGDVESSDKFKITATRTGILSVKMSDDEKTILSGSVFVVGDSADAESKVALTSLPRGVVRTKAPRNRRADGETPEGAVKLEAYPGPVAWSASNLPKGITLSIDKSASFDTVVYLKGHLEKETNKNHRFTITATNKVSKATDSITGSITVYGEPKIKTKTLPPLTLGKGYRAKIDVTGLDCSVDVAFAASTDAKVTTAALPASRGDFGKSTNFNEGQTIGKLTFDPKTMMITGSLDKFPATPISASKTNPYTAKVIVTIKATNPGYGKDDYDQNIAVSQDVVILVKGVGPKFTTKKLVDFAAYGDYVDEDGSKHPIYITGSQPMSIDAYIAAKDAKKFGLGESSIDIIVDGEGTVRDNAPEFNITKTYPDSNTTKLAVAYPSGPEQKFSLIGLPITISVDNGASAPVINVFKVNVNGYTPVILSDDGTELSKDITVNVAAGSAIPDIVLNASGDFPMEFQYSGARNGITATKGTDDATKKPKLTISGTPTAGKETKTTITATLINPQTKKKYTRKVIVTGMLAPTITSTGKALEKEVDIGKAVSFKLAAKGSKPITWSIDKPAEIVALGLSFDEKTGVLKGVATNVTSDDETKAIYTPLTIKFIASNDAGHAEKEVTFGVKGKKPKMATKTIELQRMFDEENDNAIITSGDTTLKTDILPSNMTANVQWSLAKGASMPSQLPGVTVGQATATEARNYGSFDISALGNKSVATKGVTVKVTADNFDNSVTGNVKVVVKDPAPSFDVTNKELAITAAKSAAKTGTVTFAMKPETMTGDTKITWKLAARPATPATAVLKAGSNNKTATVTVTVAKGASSKDIPASKKDEWGNHFKTAFTVTATNTVTKASTTMKVSLDITPYDVSGTEALPAEKDALPEEADEPSEEELTEEETVSDDEIPEGEGTVTYGEARGEDSFTESERTALSEGGYIIAAILPEITADESGQYDLEMVSLDEAAPEGAELVWFAFPRGVESSDDDLIVEFYDEAGAEITAVPESRKVVPAPWLEKDVTYAPVIAVKVPAAGDAKDSLEEAGEGDKVTEQAIEEAAEKAAGETEKTEGTSGEAEKVSEESQHEEQPAGENPAEEQPSEAETAE